MSALLQRVEDTPDMRGIPGPDIEHEKTEAGLYVPRQNRVTLPATTDTPTSVESTDPEPSIGVGTPPPPALPAQKAPDRLASVTRIAPGADDDTEEFEGVTAYPNPVVTPDTDEADPFKVGDPPEIEHPVEKFLASYGALVTFVASVVVGVAGQVIGFAALFGGGALGWLGAILVGGLFELNMVTGSYMGFRKIKEGRGFWEIAPWFVLSTACAGVAVFMNLTHWAVMLPALAPFFGGLTILGFLLELTRSIPAAVRKRREVREYERRKAAAEERRRELIEQQHKAEQERIAEEQNRRAKEAEARKRREALAGQRDEYDQVADELQRQGRKRNRGKPTKKQAVALGYRHARHTPAQLRDLLVDEYGFTDPGQSNLKNYCREVKDLAGIA